MTDDRDDQPTPFEEPDPLLEELRLLVPLVEPPPPEAVAAGQAAFAWRTVDAELAALVDDSLVDAQAAGLRGSETPLLLSFESDHLVIEVQVAGGGAERELVGRVVAGATPSRAVAATVTVEHAGGELSVESDEYGRFIVGGVAAGPVRLRCRPPAPAPQVVTDWVAL